MFIKYTPKVSRIKVIPLIPVKAEAAGYTFDNDTVTLRPGTNELTEKEWAAIQPHIQEQLGKEIVPFSVPLKAGVEGKENKAKTLKDVPVATARKIIQGCQDPTTLKKWFNQELPDELLLVLSKRMRKLKIEPEDLDDAEGELDFKNDVALEDGVKPKAKGGSEDVDLESPVDPVDHVDPVDPVDEEGVGRRRGKRGAGRKSKLPAADSEADEEDDDEIPDFDGSGGRE
jgi:hypothetical protein